jgi:hypothetical protein
MNRILSVLAISLAVASSLACSGLDSSFDTVKDEVNDGLEQQFREQFSKACAKQTGKGKAGNKAEEVCNCAADSLLRDNDIKDLIDMMSNLDKPESKQKMKGVMQECMK